MVKWVTKDLDNRVYVSDVGCYTAVSYGNWRRLCTALYQQIRVATECYMG